MEPIIDNTIWPGRANGTILATFGTRQVYTNEKNCLTCIRHDECWNNVDINVHPNMPQGFRLLNRWDPRDWEPYIKSIWGGVCQLWTSSDSRINERLARNEASRLAAAEARIQTKDKDWEK